MKKILALILTAILLFGCVAQAESYESWLTERAGYMLEQLNIILHDKAYMSQYGYRTLQEKCERSFATTPQKLTAYYCPENRVNAILKILTATAALKDTSEPAKKRIVDSLPNMVLNVMTGQLGYDEMLFFAAAGITESFFMPEGFVPAILMIDTGTENCAVMTVCKSGEGIVDVTIHAVPRAGIEVDQAVRLVWSLALKVRELPVKK